MTVTRLKPMIRTRMTALAVALLVGGCGDDGGGLIEPEGTSLQGVVVRAGTQVRLPDVPVTLDGRTVVSDSRGLYRFDDVAVGEVTLSAQYPGYLLYERSLDIVEGSNSFDIPLLPE